MLKIGAMTREVETEESIEVAKHFPILQMWRILPISGEKFWYLGGNLAHGCRK